MAKQFKPVPVQPTWKNVGVVNGYLRFSRELSGHFFIHARIRTKGDRATLHYEAELALPAGLPRVPAPKEFRTLTAVMVWALPEAAKQAARIMDTKIINSDE